MLRLLYIVSGALAGGATSYLLTRILGLLIEPYYRPSGEDEMTRNFIIFIVIFCVFVIIGGFVANSFYKKSITKRST